MEASGKVWKTDSKPPWAVEAPSLGVITQGYTRKEAIMMLKDAIEELLLSYFSVNTEALITDLGNGVLRITCRDKKLLLSLLNKQKIYEARRTI